MPSRPRALAAAAVLAVLATLALVPAAAAQPIELSWLPQDPGFDDVVVVRIHGSWFNGCPPVLASVHREPPAEDFPELYADPEPPLPIASRWAILLAADGDTCFSAPSQVGVNVALTGLPAGHNRVILVVDGLQLSGPFVLDMEDIFVGGAKHSLDLHGGRFRATVDWRDYQGNTGQGALAPGHTATSGLFTFFTSDNWEVMVKLLDGCTVNGRFWAFVAAATSVEYTLRIEDVLTGEVWERSNPLGELSPAFADTEAFAGCGAGG
jgi:hypothetical protein